MNGEERVDETFVVGETPQVLVTNVRGSITVRSDKVDAIRVTAVKRLEGCRSPERTEIELRQDGDRVTAKTRYRKGKWCLRGDQVCPVDYSVWVPAGCDVEVKQVKGTIHVSGVAGHVNVGAVQGAIELCEISGRTQVKAVNATIEGDGWGGRAEVSTVSGAVQISAAQLSRVKANTVSGDLSLETTLDESGHYDFHSVSGDVTFYVPPERGVVSRGSTLSGHLVCDLAHEFTRRSRGGWRATINGGGPPVRFSSVSGDLEVLGAGP